MPMLKAWIEAMRLRTLPVSLAGVIAAIALVVIYNGVIYWWPALLCLLFALLAQIASNFANEYFDYRDGLDKPGREGPRRGVTEGDISPKAMKIGAYATLALAAIAGCLMLPIGGWWLLPLGIVIVLAALAYSAGPYPLSRHGWGEVAVIGFFGVAPVCLTYYLQTLTCTIEVLASAIAIGLMGANVLIVNNYRDMEADAAVGKYTLAVRWGRKTMAVIYLFNGFIAVALMVPVWALMNHAWWIAPAVYLCGHTTLWHMLEMRSGSALNPLLGGTAILMGIYSIALLVAALC